MSPLYVVNRDGHYYAGSRCSPALFDQLDVFLASPSQDNPLGWPSGDPAAVDYVDSAFWEALADKPTAEFALFTDQPGVVVTKDDGSRPTSQMLFLLFLGKNRVYGGTGGVYLDAIGVGQAKTFSGIMSWDAYMKRPNSDYGC